MAVGTYTRKPISNKLRFEVFKRDDFTCQYCGAKAPDAVLHVDHIHPVAEGGTNDITNLITACSDCNLGKGARLLSENGEMDKKRKQIEDMKSKRDELKSLYRLEMELAAEEFDETKAACDLFEVLTGCEVLDNGKDNIRKWIVKFGLNDVMDAIRTSTAAYHDTQKAFDKIPGICWNKTHKSCRQCVHSVDTARKWIIKCKWHTYPVEDAAGNIFYEETEYKTSAAEHCDDYRSRWS